MRILTAIPLLTLALAVLAEVWMSFAFGFLSGLSLALLMWMAVFIGMWAENNDNWK